MEITDDVIKKAQEVPCSQVLTWYNVKRSPKTRGNSTFWYCPFHNDTLKPNLHVTESKNVWFCFACAAGGNVINLLGMLKFGKNYSGRGKEFIEVIEELSGEHWSHIKIKEESKIPLAVTLDDVYTFQRSLSRVGYQYLLKRGIPHPEQFRLGEIIFNNTPYITIPLIVNGILVQVQSRRNDLVNDTVPRFYMFPGSETHYPFTCFSEHDRTIFFFEDSISAMSARTFGFPSASFASGNTIPKAGRELFKHTFSEKNIIMIPDRDAAGMNGVKAFRKQGISIQEVVHAPEPYKDFNDFVQADRRGAYEFLVSLYRSA